MSIRHGSQIAAAARLQPSTRLAAALPAAGAAAGPAAGTPSPVESHPPDQGSTDAADGHRALWATLPVTAMFAGTVAKNGLDLARIFKKAPEAYLAHSRPLPEGASAIENAIHKRVGKLPLLGKQAAFIAPDTRLIDPLAPATRMTDAEIASAVERGELVPGSPAHEAALAGRSYAKLDSHANRMSGAMGAGLAALQLAVAVPNIIEGVQKDGVAGLWDSKSGRTGMLSLIGGGLGLGMMVPAFRGAQGASFGARLLGMAESPMLTSPLLANVGIAAGLLTFANELGFFDMFDKGNKRPVTQVLSDAWHKIPVLGDM